MKPVILLPIAALFSSCVAPVAQTITTPASSTAPAASGVQLSKAERTKVARQIWQNESSGQVSGLTAWNVGEEFPSLGIGHFIWYPRQVRGPFTESFPQFIQFAQRKGHQPPALAQLADCPWHTRAHFLQVQNSAEVTALRNWLAANITLQADFIIAKSQASFQQIVAAAPASDRQRVIANYNKVSTTSNGTYALIDYVNFKGEGINPKERYNGQGWGLLQVLQGMQPTSGGQSSAAEFTRAAKRALDTRIANSPAARGESRWRAGWHNRCDTYARPF